MLGSTRLWRTFDNLFLTFITGKKTVAWHQFSIKKWEWCGYVRPCSLHLSEDQKTPNNVKNGWVFNNAKKTEVLNKYFSVVGARASGYTCIEW